MSLLYRTPATLNKPDPFASGRWWRWLRGGHWEVIDFDQLLDPGMDGLRWLRMPRCSRNDLGRKPYALVHCEEPRKSKPSFRLQMLRAFLRVINE